MQQYMLLHFFFRRNPARDYKNPFSMLHSQHISTNCTAGMKPPLFVFNKGSMCMSMCTIPSKVVFTGIQSAEVNISHFGPQQSLCVSPNYFDTCIKMAESFECYFHAALPIYVITLPFINHCLTHSKRVSGLRFMNTTSMLGSEMNQLCSCSKPIQCYVLALYILL